MRTIKDVNRNKTKNKIGCRDRVEQNLVNILIVGFYNRVCWRRPNNQNGLIVTSCNRASLMREQERALFDSKPQGLQRVFSLGTEDTLLYIWSSEPAHTNLNQPQQQDRLGWSSLTNEQLNFNLQFTIALSQGSYLCNPSGVLTGWSVQISN